MAERDTLLSTLPEDVREDAEALYTDKATQDPRDIVAELHRRGRLTAGQLRVAVMALEAQLRIRRVKERPPDQLDPTVLGPLGEGAMGEVMLARDEGLNRVVALKRLHSDHANHKGLLRRFYTEAQVTAQLDHPAIVPVHGIFPGADGTLAYTMKLVRGETLEDYLATAQAQEKAGRADEEHNLQARLTRFLHVCDALAYAHNKGVLHRDLKPENIMVGAFGEVLVMDWGIAKLLEGSNVELIDTQSGQSRSATETRIGRVIGTPRYMSPEQAAGQNDVINTPSDQYALGLILQELVCFTPGCPHKVTLEQALGRAQKANRQTMTGPRELIAIVDKACSHTISNRYDTVDAFADDIRRYLRDEAVLARRDSVLQRLGRFVSRHRTGVLMLIMFLFITILLTSGFLAMSGVAAHEYRRWVTENREARLSQVLADTSKGAMKIDDELAHVQALVVGLSFAAEAAMNTNDVEMPEREGNLEGPPSKGLMDSNLYGRPIVADRPSFAVNVGRGKFGENQKEDVLRLLSVGPQMARVLADSQGRDLGGTDRKDRTRMVAKGVPVRWVRIATSDGVLAIAPGSEGLDRNREARKERWYRDGSTAKSAVWSPPTEDAALKELVISVSHPVYTFKGSLSGVVSADLSLDHVIQLMRTEDAKDAWLLDRDGRVLATKTMKKAKSYDPPPFPSRNVFDAIQKSRSGWLTTGGDVYSWSSLTTVPEWTFVSVQDL
jgi:eukaryotic-like serine/threonine-protein kinase